MPKINQAALKRKIKEFGEKYGLTKPALDWFLNSGLEQAEAEEYIRESIPVLDALGRKYLNPGHLEFVKEVKAARENIRETDDKMTKVFAKEYTHSLKAKKKRGEKKAKTYQLSAESATILSKLDQETAKTIIDYSRKLVDMDGKNTLQPRYVSAVESIIVSNDE